MEPILVDLKTDSALLDSNFDGYKLSLNPFEFSKVDLPRPVQTSLLNSAQYSLLHSKLFGLHNHLFWNPYDGALYFVDNQRNLMKTFINAGGILSEPALVFQFGKCLEEYPPTVCFANSNYTIVADGIGMIYILLNSTQVFCEKILSNDNGFVLKQASFDEELNLHLVMLHIEKDEAERFSSVVDWVSLKECNGQWGQTELRQLKTKGEVEYLHLETTCKYLYVVSDEDVKFTLNSEQPVDNVKEHRYEWYQNLEDVNIDIKFDDINSQLLSVTTTNTHINVTYNGNVVIDGDLAELIDADLTTWTVNGNTLNITLQKQTNNLWKEIIEDDLGGLQILKQKAMDFVQSGEIFNSTRVEDCDFESDKTNIFTRFDRSNRECHKIHFGTHRVLLAPQLEADVPPAIGLRHDVDVCLWQPIEAFECRHVGTLLAFGYIQASKVSRKFISCAPDLSYAVISEATGHIFIYRQNKPLINTNLRNRTNGRRMTTIAEQQVFNLPNQDILGILATNSYLYVLTETFVVAINMEIIPQ